MERTLVLGLGNDLLADDGVGVIAARRLESTLDDHVDVLTSAAHGLSLLDLFLGYSRAVVIDAIRTRRHPPGTVIEMAMDEMRPVSAPSPHYAGLPELVRLAEKLDLDFPADIRILAVEARDLHSIGARMTAEVEACIPELCNRVRRMVASRP